MDAPPKRFWTWMLVPLGSLLFSAVYFHVLMPVKATGDVALFGRGIGSPLLKFVNGYLGAYFNLRYLGNTVCWALPAVVFLFLRWRLLEPWHRGVALFLTLAALLIGVAGGFNYRYAFTLSPALIALTMLVTDEGMKRSALSIRQRSWVHIVFALLTVVNTKMAIDHSSRVVEANPIAHVEEDEDKPFFKKFNTAPDDLDGWFSAMGVPPTERMLVNNLPLYYFRTQRPGAYYWCGADQYFGPDGEEGIFRGRTDDEVVRFLADTMRIRCIFSDRYLSHYDPRFEAFLEQHCTLLAQDDFGNTVHVLNDAEPR